MKKPSPKSVVRKSLYAGGVLVALLVGTALGTGTSGQALADPAPAPTVTASPEPAPTVTVTPKPEIKEVPVEVVKEVTPQACLDALDHAGSGLAIASELIGQIHPAAMAGLNQDVAAIEQITSEMQVSNAEMENLTPLASAAATECRAAAE